VKSIGRQLGLPVVNLASMLFNYRCCAGVASGVRQGTTRLPDNGTSNVKRQPAHGHAVGVECRLYLEASIALIRIMQRGKRAFFYICSGGGPRYFVIDAGERWRSRSLGYAATTGCRGLP